MAQFARSCCNARLLHTRAKSSRTGCMRAVRKYTLTIFAGKQHKLPHTLQSLPSQPSKPSQPPLPPLRLLQAEAEAGAVQQPLEAEAGAVLEPLEAEAGAVLEPGEAGQVVYNCFAAQSTANAKSPRKCWKMSGRSG